MALEEHAGDLLAAFNDYRASPNPKKIFDFHSFITPRCWPVIAHRLTTDRFIFGDYSVDAFLEKWKPEPTDAFPPNTFITVPGFLARYLTQQANAESFGLVHGGKVRAEWTRETAPHWIAWLGKTLRKAKTTVAKSALKPITKDGGLPSLRVEDIGTGLSTLKFLQSFLRLPMGTLLRVESITHELQSAHAAYVLSKCFIHSIHPVNKNFRSRKYEDGAKVKVGHAGEYIRYIYRNC